MSTQPTPPILKRILITLSLGLAFIVMASIFSPERLRASDDARLPRAAGRANVAPRHSQRDARGVEAREAGMAISVDAHAGLRSLGVIETGRYSVAIFATDAGPRYTIFARDSAEELGTLLSAQQVQQLLPEIDLQAMDFSTAGPQQLMLTESQD